MVQNVFQKQHTLRNPALVQFSIREGGDILKPCEMKKMCRSIRCLDAVTLHGSVSIPLGRCCP